MRSQRKQKYMLLDSWLSAHDTSYTATADSLLLQLLSNIQSTIIGIVFDNNGYTASLTD